MILTSNQSFGAWGDVFGDRIIATAIFERLLLALWRQLGKSLMRLRRCARKIPG
jgi:DNA replication protein DnaC